VVDKCTFNDHDTRALVWYVKNNKRNTYSGDWQWQCGTWSHCASEKQSVNNYILWDDIVLQWLKPFITKTNAHLRVQWCKKQKQTQALFYRYVGGKWYGHPSYSPQYKWASARVAGIHQENQERAGCLMVCSMKMWIKCYGLRSHQISIQLNTNVRLLDTERALSTTIIKTLNE